jgi:hypothetical protein
MILGVAECYGGDQEARVLVLMALIAPSNAETADEVIAKARAANQVQSSIESMRMTIVPKSGTPRVLEAELRTKREGEANKSYLKILSPSTEAGTQLLQIDNPTGNDEQMLYLPAFKRVNLISGSARKGAFLGSDFTYEDLDIRESIEGTNTMVSDTADAWTIDTAMTDSSYSKVRATIGKTDLVVRKVEFYKADKVVKVLEVKRTEKDGTHTIPVESEMSDVTRGTKTKLEITAHKLNVTDAELPAETFTKAYLERGG